MTRNNSLVIYVRQLRLPQYFLVPRETQDSVTQSVEVIHKLSTYDGDLVYIWVI